MFHFNLRAMEQLHLTCSSPSSNRGKDRGGTNVTTNIHHQVSGFAESHAATKRSHAAAEAASDYELVERIAAGDKLAMRVLYGRHSLHVFRFAARILHGETSAEDV